MCFRKRAEREGKGQRDEGSENVAVSFSRYKEVALVLLMAPLNVPKPTQVSPRPPHTASSPFHPCPGPLSQFLSLSGATTNSLASDYI